MDWEVWEGDIWICDMTSYQVLTGFCIYDASLGSVGADINIVDFRQLDSQAPEHRYAATT